MEHNFPVSLDLRVKVININYNKSADILDKSRTLKDYSYFIHQVKYYKESLYTLNESIELAMKNCISHNILKDFLEEHGSKVMNMLFTEFNLEDAKEIWISEAENRGIKIGQQKGIEIGQQKGIEIGTNQTKLTIATSLLGILDPETIALKTGLSINEINTLIS